MKKYNKKSNTPRNIIIIVFLIILLGMCAYFIFVNKKPPEGTAEPEEATQITQDSDDSYVDAGETITPDIKIPIQNETSVDQNEITGNITSQSVNSEILQIRLQIDQYLLSGTCTITIGTFWQTVNIVPNASSSTCKGFDLEIADLPSNANNFTINIESNGKTGTINGEINL
ncbi:MAG: hypothetical protein LBM97_00615 [Candidatus Nomurabacteria bacterium]|jgi:hypothetical protein|nr:hypothetical protein [Candidatus Nomurabacteria bacterium]